VWLQLAPLLFWAPQAFTYLNDTLVGAVAIIFSFMLAKRKELPNIPEHPKGWSYNPSSWSHRIPTVALAMMCWFFSRYMAAFQLGYIDAIWDPVFTDGTLRVITSTISQSFPVSDAGLGAVCYTMEALLGWQGDEKRWARMPWLVTAFGFLVIPVGIVSITLIILQPVVVGAWCAWCLATAAFMLLMIVFTAGELMATLQFLCEVKARKESVWNAFWKGGIPEKNAAVVKPRFRALTHTAWGITLPWNLILMAIIGIWLMISPVLLKLQGHAAICDYILGPMVIAAAVISMAEVCRPLRFVGAFFGLCLVVAPWFVQGISGIALANYLCSGAVIIALSYRQGTIRERYGVWEKCWEKI
jgi:uncharacterized membrane protein